MSVVLSASMLIICTQVDLTWQIEHKHRDIVCFHTLEAFLGLVLLTLELSLVLLSIVRGISTDKQPIYRSSILRLAVVSKASPRLRSDHPIQYCYRLRSFNSYPSAGMEVLSFVTARFILKDVDITTLTMNIAVIVT